MQSGAFGEIGTMSDRTTSLHSLAPVAYSRHNNSTGEPPLPVSTCHAARDDAVSSSCFFIRSIEARASASSCLAVPSPPRTRERPRPFGQTERWRVVGDPKPFAVPAIGGVERGSNFRTRRVNRTAKHPCSAEPKKIERAGLEICYGTGVFILRSPHSR